MLYISSCTYLVHSRYIHSRWCDSSFLTFDFYFIFSLFRDLEMHRTPSAQMLNGSATTSASTVINGSATTGDLFLLCIKKKTENTTRKLCDDRNWLMWWLMLWIMMTKGQTISEWIYEVVISPKIDFCPHYTGQKSWQFFVSILEKFILKITDL